MRRSSMTRQITRRQFVAGTAGSLALAALALAGCSTNDNSEDKNDPSKGGTLEEPVDNAYKSGKHHATMTVKDFGTIKLELNADVAPITVSNFCQLVSDGFYNGLTFHRIIDGFMIQGGDPKGDGTGGTDHTIKGEFIKNGVQNVLQHKRGVISMARSKAYDSASSQFFIMQADNDSLDGLYAAFGKVTEGMEVVDTIAKVPVTDSNGTVEKDKQPQIESISMDD